MGISERAAISKRRPSSFSTIHTHHIHTFTDTPLLHSHIYRHTTSPFTHTPLLSVTNKHPSMAANTPTLALFCLISVDSASCAFHLNLPAGETVGALKRAIIGENPNTFEYIDANDLVLWRATIPIEEESIITLDDLDSKTKLGNPRTCLSELFLETPDDTTYIVVERPKGILVF